MKKFIPVLSLLTVCGLAMAQGPADALLYTSHTYTGTARSIALGNACVALGGDIGAISLNPASSAVYRYSELSITPAVINAGSTTGTAGTSYNSSFTNFKINGGGFVFAFDTYRKNGLLNFNIGFNVNRLADFNKMSSGNWTSSTSSMLAPIASSLEGTPESELAYTDSHNPYSETSLPWNSILAYDAYLVSPLNPGSTTYIASTQNIDPNTGNFVIGGPLDQYYFNKSTGGILEYALNIGFNISDIVYLGANINFHTVSYRLNTYYCETAMDSRRFDDGIQSFSSEYILRTGGTGTNFEIGAIITPLAGLRIGATFTTPTIYKLTDNWNYYMNSAFDNGNSYSRYSPTGAFSYRIKAPLRWSVGAAYTFGNFGLLSVDWESTDCSALRLSNYAGNEADFRRENTRIANGFNTSSNLRAGVEIKPINRLSLRGGYNLIKSAGNLIDSEGAVTYRYPDTQYVSCGVGYRFGLEKAMSLDFAYQRMLNNREQFTIYYGAPTSDVMNYLNRFVLTFAYRL